MITVQILINGQVIYARSAVNITKEPDCFNEDKLNIYKNCDGQILKHKPKCGAVKLAKMMLDTIDEVK